MMQVLSAISSRLADEYGKIEIRSDAARERILHDARYMRSKFSELKGLERDVPGAELEDLIKMKRKVEPPPPVAAPASAASTPAKMFSTPSLTRSRSSFSQQHRRTPSSASISKAPDSSTPASIAEEPAKSGEFAQSSAAAELRAKTTETVSGVNTPDLSTATQVAEPLDIKTDITPDAHLDQPLLDSIGGVAAAQSPADIPLPPSPSIEDPPIEESKPPAETRLTDPAGIIEAAPSTPMKDHKRQLSAPPPLVPEKPASPLSSPAIAPAPAPAQVPAAAQTTPAATPTKSPPPPAPVGNVKNRLAGLFNKRPTASLPKIDLPNSLPKIDLPKVSIPASLQRVMSPDKQAGMGSPSQAKSSLDLPRARALMDKQTQEDTAARDREQSHGTAITEEKRKTVAVDPAAPVLSEPKAEPHDEAAGTADKPASPVVPVGEAAVEGPPPADDAAVESAHVDKQVHVAPRVLEAISAPVEGAEDPSHAGKEAADLGDASAASNKETPTTNLVVQDINEQAQAQGQEHIQAAGADAKTAPAVSELEPEMQEAKARQEPVPDVAEASTEPGMGDTGEKDKAVSDAPREQD
jgi:vacuolar protein sorting-associated protein 54